MGALSVGLSLAGSLGTAGAVTTIPLPPFTQCPPVGASPSCKVLLVVEADGSVTVYSDDGVGDYDGGDDTLVGIVNHSNSPVSAVTVSGPGSSLGSFDGDGLCTFTQCSWPAATGYEGPVNTFVTNPALPDAAEVDFAQGLGAGAATYFSLEGTLTSASLTARQGHLTGVGYVAMGDSYSSGEGNPKPPFFADSRTTTDACHRSPIAYPELLVDDPSAGFTRSDYSFVACSGATRRDLWKGNLANHEPSQLNALSASTGLVTLSVGGNDVDFPGVLAHCVTGNLTTGGGARSDDCQNLKVPVSGSPGPKETLDQHETRLIADLGATTLCETPSGFVTCTPSLAELYKSIAQGGGPSVRLRVLLYPHLFTTTPDPQGCRLLDAQVVVGVLHGKVATVHLRAFISKKNMQWINAGVDKVDAKIIKQAETARLAGVDVQVVDPRKTFDSGGTSSPGGHGACTQQPWMNGISLKGLSPKPYSFHPNVTGQQQFYMAIGTTLH